MMLVELSGDTRTEPESHRSTWGMLAALANGRYIARVHCVRATLNANETHSVSSTNTAMWWPRRGTAHSLRCDWKSLACYALVCPSSRRQCRQSNNGLCWVPKVLPANLCQMSEDTAERKKIKNEKNQSIENHSHAFRFCFFHLLCNFVWKPPNKLQRHRVLCQMCLCIVHWLHPRFWLSHLSCPLHRVLHLMRI